MRGEWAVAGSQPMGTAVHITWHGAQENFGDLPPYLTYGCRTSQLQDHRLKEYKLPSPPLLNVMYCVRVSLWTVKIFLAQVGRGFNLCISLGEKFFQWLNESKRMFINNPVDALATLNCLLLSESRKSIFLLINCVLRLNIRWIYKQMLHKILSVTVRCQPNFMITF